MPGHEDGSENPGGSAKKVRRRPTRREANLDSVMLEALTFQL